MVRNRYRGCLVLLSFWCTTCFFWCDLAMAEGETKTVQLKATEAFGEVDEELIIEIPANKLPENAQVGSVLTSEEDQEQQWRVLEVQEEVAVIDGNHPLAGQDLAFEIKLVSVTDKPSGEPTIQ